MDDSQIVDLYWKRQDKALWCLKKLSIPVQINTHLITVFHENTPNTGWPVLGVHIRRLDEKNPLLSRRGFIQSFPKHNKESG